MFSLSAHFHSTHYLYAINRDVPMGEWVASRLPQYFQICKKVGKSYPGSNRVGLSIFCDLYLFSNNVVTIVGQLVRTPPPQQKVSQYITGNKIIIQSF